MATAVIAALALTALQTAGAQAIRAPGLSAPGTIQYDAEGVPLIRGSNDNDVAFLQGYAHAEARFFQMDLTRRAVSGALAELVGASQLSADVQSRTLGLRRAAFVSWRDLSNDMRGWLQAYADGVNFWLRTRPLPPEYGALELTRAEAWTPVDSVLVGKALAFQLSFDLDITPTLNFSAFQAAGRTGGFDGTALYFGDVNRIAPADDRVSVPGFRPGGSTQSEIKLKDPSDPMGLNFAKSTHIAEYDPSVLQLADSMRQTLSEHPLFKQAMDRREALIGSNEWVVSGVHTASGRPIIANDPHLGLDVPPVFMEQHLVSAEVRDGTALDTVGVSVPGAPGIIQGCNQRVCWGTTTNSLDVTDVFSENLRLNTYGLPTAIVHNGNDEAIEWIFQTYNVNPVGDGVRDNVRRETSIGYSNGGITFVIPRRNNGPILSLSGTTALSVAYVGFSATKELESFRRINRAANLAQFQDALTYFDVGSQNFAYADVAGNIAYFVTAEAPVRTDLQTQNAPGGGVPPWFIRDGSGASRHEWLPVQRAQPNQALAYEILPANEMPRVINPTNGYVANANNDPIGFSLDNNALNQTRPGGGIYYLDVGGASAYRQGRIDRSLQRLIASGRKITLGDMQGLQSNNQLLDAELTLQYLLGAFDRARASGAWPQLAALSNDARVAEAIMRLRAWDFSTPTGITQGFDPGDNPSALTAPSQSEIDASVAATIFAMWRGVVVRNTVNSTLTRVGLSGALPGSRSAQTGLKFLLDNFDALRGRSASGLDFFPVTGAPNSASARDFVLLNALKEGLDRLASAELSAAFNRSQNLADYRWGLLHRIVFDHPLGSLAPQFNLPGPNPYGFVNVSASLSGVARSGGYEAVDASSHSATAVGVNDFMFGAGPARRFVGEMTDLINATQILPGGQSGVLGNPLYASQLGRWLTNQYKPLIIRGDDAAAQSTSTLQFTP